MEKSGLIYFFSALLIEFVTNKISWIHLLISIPTISALVQGLLTDLPTVLQFHAVPSLIIQPHIISPVIYLNVNVIHFSP